MNSPLFDVEELIKANKSKSSEKTFGVATRKIMRAMLEIDVDKQVIAEVLSMMDIDKQLIKYMAGLMITSKTEWRDSVPSWVWRAIALDRFDSICSDCSNGIVGKLASSTEILAVMMPLSLEVPLSHEWADVYLWAGNEAMTKHNKLPGGRSFWEATGFKPVAFKSIKHDYERLARDIRESVIKYSPNITRKVIVADQEQALSEGENDVIQMNLMETERFEEPTHSVAPPNGTIQLDLFSTLE